MKIILSKAWILGNKLSFRYSKLEMMKDFLENRNKFLEISPKSLENIFNQVQSNSKKFFSFSFSRMPSNVTHRQDQSVHPWSENHAITRLECAREKYCSPIRSLRDYAIKNRFNNSHTARHRLNFLAFVLLENSWICRLSRAQKPLKLTSIESASFGFDYRFGGKEAFPSLPMI